MKNQSFNYGLKINGHSIVHGDNIKITKIDGTSNLSYLFRIGNVDEVIIRFFNHEKYNVLMTKFFLKKNDSIISIGDRFERTQEDFVDNPKLYRRMPTSPCEMTTNFADELEKSNAELYHPSKK